MSYPGDVSLNREIQDRILTTFDQTLELAASGKRTEALLGCDFMLSLDPLFEPARLLKQRVEGASGPIAVADLDLSNGSGSADSLDLPALELPASALVDAPPDLPDLGTVAGEVPSAASANDERVQKLLDEGQRELEQQHYQAAIDSWSRIFLIDIEHAEANRRIEDAQRLKAEREREIEELYNEGARHLDQGDNEQAEEVLGRVLRMQPDHQAALQALEGILNPKPKPGGIPTAEFLDEAAIERNEDPPAPWTPPADVPELYDPEATIRQAVDFEAAGFPGLDSAEPPPLGAGLGSRAGSKASSQKGGNRRFLVIGSAVLVLVLLAAAMVWSNWGRLFPNSAEEPVARETPQRRDRITGIHALYQDGRQDDAIAALEAIGQNEPDYDRAQLLLEEWKAPATPAAASVDNDPVQESQRQQLIELAREAYAETEYLPAARLFARASAVAPLDASDADLFTDAKRQLEPLAQMIDLYTQKEYELVLPSLWRYHEENPSNRDVRRLLVNVHYNQAVRDLRRNRAPQAKALLDEALRLDPQDAFAQRLLLFAKTYSQTPRDLLYQIFVDNLETRP